MKRYITFFACLTIVSCLCSCKKYLDKKPDDAMVVPVTIEDMQALMDRTDKMNIQTPGFGEASADDYFVLEGTYNGRSDREKRIYTWQDPQYVYSNDWSDNYEPVYIANVCLEQIEKVAKTPVNETSWHRVKGSALFFRAYYFMQLAWVFSKAYDESTAGNDLGIVLRRSSDFNIPSVRSSVKETYEQILSDALESVGYLEDHAAVPTRPSKTAAYGLLARVYLSMRNYAKAGEYANLGLQLRGQLLDFKTADVKLNTNFPFQRFNKETLFYTTMSTPGLLSISNGLIDTTLYNSYAASDLRKKAYFLARTGYYRFKGTYSASARYFSGIATDELYLVRAECRARSGDKDGALDDLNTLLRTRFDVSFVPFTAVDAGEALNIILLERRKELLFRGLRWIEIKRLNKEGRNIIPNRLIAGQSYRLEPNDNRYAFPLPIDIIDITGMPQNPR